DISYFDVYKAGELDSVLFDYTARVHGGIGVGLSEVISTLTVLIAGSVIALIKIWKLALVMLTISPILFVLALICAKRVAMLTSKELKASSKADSVAQEVFTSVRTVFAYNGAQFEQQRYSSHLALIKQYGIQKRTITGFFLGTIWLLYFVIHGIGFVYGGKIIHDDPRIGVGSIVVSFDGSSTNVNHSSLKETNNFNGDIEFENVHFSYPTRTDVTVLNGLSFFAKQGETVALCGASGCGKSTCVQLLLRFYDPILGNIKINGRSIDQYNLMELRQSIGVVNQEPALFGATIYENIAYGKNDNNVTMKEIEEAAKKANAHYFIMKLPDKYQTFVGENGLQLSGGEKQRICIARALIKNPKILLLDEPTSALDNESEKIVQKALDDACKDRTTIVIAHRLSTIRHANKIYVLEHGRLIEEGTHETLMLNEQGKYYEMAQMQQSIPETMDEKEEDSDESDQYVK
ncbi:unnamed protein product, partial [Didymodactylos carnosus]